MNYADCVLYSGFIPELDSRNKKILESYNPKKFLDWELILIRIRLKEGKIESAINPVSKINKSLLYWILENKIKYKIKYKSSLFSENRELIEISLYGKDLIELSRISGIPYE